MSRFPTKLVLLVFGRLWGTLWQLKMSYQIFYGKFNLVIIRDVYPLTVERGEIHPSLYARISFIIIIKDKLVILMLLSIGLLYISLVKKITKYSICIWIAIKECQNHFESITFSWLVQISAIKILPYLPRRSWVVTGGSDDFSAQASFIFFFIFLLQINWLFNFLFFIFYVSEF